MKWLRGCCKLAKLQGIQEQDEKMSGGEENAQRCTSAAMSRTRC